MPTHRFLCMNIAAFLMIAACGSGKQGNPASAAMFVGSWTSSDSTGQSEQCGTQTSTIPLWGAVQISLTAPNSGEILTQPGNGCALTWACNGNLATLEANSSCQVIGSDGSVWKASFTSGTLTLGSNTISLQDQGTAVFTSGGASQNCTFTQSGSFKNN
jgi:hypothetical protein